MEIQASNDELPTYKVEGRRLVNIAYFWDQVKQIKHMPMFNCNITYCDIINETTRGLFSSFTIKCTMCGAMSKIQTDDSSKEFDVNKAAVLGKLKRITFPM